MFFQSKNIDESLVHWIHLPLQKKHLDHLGCSLHGLFKQTKIGGGKQKQNRFLWYEKFWGCSFEDDRSSNSIRPLVKRHSDDSLTNCSPDMLQWNMAPCKVGWQQKHMFWNIYKLLHLRMLSPGFFSWCIMNSSSGHCQPRPPSTRPLVLGVSFIPWRLSQEAANEIGTLLDTLWSWC